MREIDLTKVSLDPKGLAWLFVGLLVVLIIFGLAAWGYGGIRGLFAAKAPEAASTGW